MKREKRKENREKRIENREQRKEKSMQIQRNVITGRKEKKIINHHPSSSHKK